VNQHNARSRRERQGRIPHARYGGVNHFGVVRCRNQADHDVGGPYLFDPLSGFLRNR
jgi:hypothetical protein